MVIQTLALDLPSTQTIHKPSHAMTWRFTSCWNFCFVFAWYTVYPSVPEVVSRCSSVKTWNLSKNNSCRLQQLVLLRQLHLIIYVRHGRSIQEIGDVNAMKAAYLNDEQIVKAVVGPGFFGAI